MWSLQLDAMHRVLVLKTVQSLADVGHSSWLTTMTVDDNIWVDASPLQLLIVQHLMSWNEATRPNSYSLCGLVSHGW